MILSELPSSYSAAVDATSGLGLLVGAPADDEAAHGRWETAVVEVERLVGYELDVDPAWDEPLLVGLASGGRVAWALRAVGAYADPLGQSVPAGYEDDRAEDWHALAHEAGVLLDPGWC